MTEEINKNDINATSSSTDPRQSDHLTAELACHTAPFVLMDAFATYDSGHLLMVHYVDVGASSGDWEHVVLVKGLEAEYSLAHSSSIRISSPHRFHDLGETLIRDEQEGRAQNRAEESEKNEYSAERREQEEALHQLGQTHVRLGPQNSWNSQNETESYRFGTGSWIFCTAVQPTSENEWTKLRHKLPATYNDYTTIHQPRKFAHALGLMFLDQVGPNTPNGRFTHRFSGTKSIVSLHDTLQVMHGPVLYTEDVYDFLTFHKDSALAKIYPLFVKDIKHRNQREYRFVIVGNDELGKECRDIVVSGMMRDSLLPVRATSAVRIESLPQDDQKDKSIIVEPKGYSKRKDQTRGKREVITRTICVDGEERQREEQTREVIMSLTSESVVKGDVVADLAAEQERHTGNLVERRNKSVKVDGVLVETHNSESVQIGYIANADDFNSNFSLEDKSEAEEVIEQARKLGPSLFDSAELRERTSRLLEITFDPGRKKSIEVAGTALHAMCALINLHGHFGDVVDSVEIEKERFIAIGLKPSGTSDATGKLLVGPLGTYAYLLRRGEEEIEGVGGEESKLVLFPSVEDAEKFAEYGWLAEDADAEDQ